MFANDVCSATQWVSLHVLPTLNSPVNGTRMPSASPASVMHLTASLPISSIVLETDAPDIPPQWVYRTAKQRAQGEVQGRNEPGELPRIAENLAKLQSISQTQLATGTLNSVQNVLHKVRVSQGYL